MYENIFELDILHNPNRNDKWSGYVIDVITANCQNKKSRYTFLYLKITTFFASVCYYFLWPVETNLIFHKLSGNFASFKNSLNLEENTKFMPFLDAHRRR